MLLECSATSSRGLWRDKGTPSKPVADRLLGPNTTQRGLASAHSRRSLHAHRASERVAAAVFQQQPGVRMQRGFGFGAGVRHGLGRRQLHRGGMRARSGAEHTGQVGMHGRRKLRRVEERLCRGRTCGRVSARVMHASTTPP